MTPSSQARQAYLGRRVTTTRNCAGTMSSRSLLSSPIRCSSPWQQGQVLSSMSTTTSIRGRCAGSAPRLTRRLRARSARPSGAVSSSTGLGKGRDLLDVLEAQQHLLLGKRLCLPAKAVALQFLDDLTQPLALVKPLASSIALSVSGSSGRLSLTGKSEHIRARLTTCSMPLIHFVAARLTIIRLASATTVSRAAWTRRQSSPSSSADNSAADKRITPSSIFGQRKTPSSSRLANRHKPVPSQKISLIRSARLARNT